jgi:hypothetical protein
VALALAARTDARGAGGATGAVASDACNGGVASAGAAGVCDADKAGATDACGASEAGVDAVGIDDAAEEADDAAEDESSASTTTSVSTLAGDAAVGFAGVEPWLLVNGGEG